MWCVCGGVDEGHTEKATSHTLREYPIPPLGGRCIYYEVYGTEAVPIAAVPYPPLQPKTVLLFRLLSQDKGRG